jgi:hypothetical protein
MSDQLCKVCDLHLLDLKFLKAMTLTFLLLTDLDSDDHRQSSNLASKASTGLSVSLHKSHGCQRKR